MLLRTVSLWLANLLAVSQCIRVNSVEKSKDFPIRSEVENLVVRPSGSVLAVVYTFPQIYEVPVATNATPKVIATFENTHGVSSIAKSSTPDVYFVITGNFSFTNFTPTARSYAIHRLSFDACNNAITKELAPLDAISQPNGMTHVPNTPYVLIADSRAGFIYRFNTETFELTTFFDHPLLKANGTALFPGSDVKVIFGVNGIKLSRGYLYFSNTNRQFVARVKATGKECPLVGTPKIIATQTPADDIILNDLNGDLYIAENGGNALSFVGGCSNSTIPEIILGGGNSTVLQSPTAVIWAKGAEGRTLLVSTAGDFTQFFTPDFQGPSGEGIQIVHLDQRD